MVWPEADRTERTDLAYQLIKGCRMCEKSKVLNEIRSSLRRDLFKLAAQLEIVDRIISMLTGEVGADAPDDLVRVADGAEPNSVQVATPVQVATRQGATNVHENGAKSGGVRSERKKTAKAPHGSGTGTAAEVRRWIFEVGGPDFSIDDLRRHVKGTQSAVSCALIKMVKRGELERRGHGQYRKTDKFEAPMSPSETAARYKAFRDEMSSATKTEE